MGKIFISHSSANNAEALAIHDWLAERGWGDVFLDLDPRRGLVAGDRWQAALKAAAEQCELILILISPNWAKSKWCLAEFLLAKQMNKQILGVVVKPTPYEDLPVELTAEWQLVDLSAPDAGWSVTVSPPRFEPETLVNFSGAGLARLAAGLQKAGLDATHFLWPPDGDPDRAPYRGLLPLEADDAGIFFGRDGAIILTLDALRGLRAAAAPRFATILGASGAGKSSFLRAGLLPRLARDSRHFAVLPVIRPERAALTGEHGFAAMLEAALKSRNIIRNRADIHAALTGGADTVRPLLRLLSHVEDAGDGATGDPPTLVIAVDQAEELLTADNSEAGAFVALLADLAATGDPAILVLLTVRSDSFDQLQSRPELAATQPHHLVDLRPVPFGSFGEIIRGPARRVTAAGRKLVVEETLVDALMSDIEQGGAKDALPLLAFTLERLYRYYGADGDLQLAEYEKLGRIRGAIEAAVEQALGKADGNPAIPRDRAARLALLRRGLIPWLAGIDPATGSPRRRVARLAEVPTEALPLIELMVGERLLATDIDKPTGERTIEPAHEALLRQWGALDGWLVEDSADLSIVEALRRSATDWDANARGPDFLVHTGARLATAEQVASGDTFATYLTSVDHAYLDTARARENAVLAKARAAVRRINIAAAVAGIVLVVGLAAGYFIWSAGQAAKTEAAASFETARAEAALRAGHPEEGARAALAAWDLLPSTATRTAALSAAMSVSPNATAIYPVTGRVADTAFLDPEHLLVLSGNGALTTLDLGMRKAATTSLATSPLPIGLVPDGQGDAHAIFADASMTTLDGRPVAAPTNEDFAPRAGTVRASADGKLIAMVGLVGDVLVRDCRTRPCRDIHLVAPAGGDPGLLAGSLAIKPDGTGLAVNWWPGFVAIYGDLAAPPKLTPLSSDLASLGVVVGIDWSAVTDQIVLSTDSGQIVLLDPTGRTPPKSLDLGITTAAIAWSPTEPVFALACDTTTICLYRDSGARQAAFTGHTGKIASIRWSADGQNLVSVAPYDPVRVWSVAEDDQVAAGRNTPAWTALTALTVDHSRSVTAVGDETGALWVWSEGYPAPARFAIPGIDKPVSSLAFLADGRLAAVYEDTAIGVWSVRKTEPDKLVKLDNLQFSRVAALTGDIRVAIPLSDKTTLVLSGDDLREARVPADSMPLDQWGLTAAPAANAAFVSYSDGSIRRRDLGAGGEGTVVFDARTSTCGASPTSDNNGSKSLDVSADGRWLVATRTDAAVIVHNLADPAKPVCLALPAPDSKTVAFSPDSKRLAVLSATDRLYVFDLAQPDTALILGAPAVPANSPLAVAAGTARETSWLAWQDDATLLVSTTAGVIGSIHLDPTGWRARVDSLFFTQ